MLHPWIWTGGPADRLDLGSRSKTEENDLEVWRYQVIIWNLDGSNGLMLSRFLEQ